MKKSLIVFIAVLLMVFSFAVAEGCEHSFTVETVSGATCTSGAVQREKCTICGYVNDTWTSGSALGHNYEKSLKSEATCTAPAEYTFKCSRCGDSYTQTEGSAKGHNYVKGAQVKAATCTAPAEFTFKCSGCGDSYTKADGSANGHNWAVSVKEATCSNAKTYTEACTVCGTVNQTWTEGAALNHTHAIETSEKANCLHGNKMREYCTVCNATIDTWDDGKLGEHDFAAASCTLAKTCKVCGKTEGAALGHKWASRLLFEATCIDSEISEDYCTVCGVISKEAYASAAPLGHDWYKRVVKPTETSRGYTEYTCLRCGQNFRTNYTDKLAAQTAAVVADVALNPYGNIVTDLDDNEMPYTAELEEDGKHVCIKAKAADNGAFELRELHLSLALIESLKADGVEEICFVVGDAELVVPFTALEGDLIEEIKAAFPATMTGYIITLDPNAVNDEGAAGCLVKVDMTADVASAEAIVAEDGIEMEITDVVPGMSLLLGETPITVVGGGVYTA